MKINRLFFIQGFVGQQTDLKQYSKPYWQPRKGTNQWNTVSKWKSLCHQGGQSIVNALRFGEVSAHDTIHSEQLHQANICGYSSLISLNTYRPLDPATTFFSEFQDILSYMASLPHDLVLMGDFNLHIDSFSSNVRQLTGCRSFHLDRGNLTALNRPSLTRKTHLQ